MCILYFFSYREAKQERHAPDHHGSDPGQDQGWRQAEASHLQEVRLRQVWGGRHGPAHRPEAGPDEVQQMAYQCV